MQAALNKMQSDYLDHKEQLKQDEQNLRDTIEIYKERMEEFLELARVNNTVPDSESKDLITSILEKALGSIDDCMTLAEKSIGKNAIIDQHQKCCLKMMRHFQKLYTDTKKDHAAAIKELKEVISKLDKHVKTLEKAALKCETDLIKKLEEESEVNTFMRKKLIDVTAQLSVKNETIKEERNRYKKARENVEDQKKLLKDKILELKLFALLGARESTKKKLQACESEISLMEQLEKEKKTNASLRQELEEMKAKYANEKDRNSVEPTKEEGIELQKWMKNMNIAA
ncbi:Oidioi.mRNA.OKI2018_I69.chr2.g4951.t1.cds [Oikopleura dioica]|uniref:Oidioi.mRNA.OKI2018_I69.chr2.g4951.t1.cds n=1 Tax=Oikopleura dioica TaxID=34765 RepID=A0ABN7T5G6_OIKDI|nr:Oidioi.mRNA.OKI2018_I69.chr2.g4951.t1.cds [Oikopleura dioica]